METNKYIDAISVHLKDTPNFNSNKDYYAWKLCEFKLDFFEPKRLNLRMYDSCFTLAFDFGIDRLILKSDDLKRMLALLELDKKTTSLSRKLSSSTKLKVLKPKIIFQHDSDLFLVLDDGKFEVLYTSEEFTEYEQYDHYESYYLPYGEPGYIDERLLRLMIAALEAN